MNKREYVDKDEIDLRELFATIGRYKKSIILITLTITLIASFIAYKMPTYYKTSTIIEVKAKDGSKSFSLGGAGALLGLAGIGGGATNTDKEAAQLLMFSSNSKALDKVSFTATYWYKDKFRYLPLDDNYSSITIKNYKTDKPSFFALNAYIKPISNSKFKIYKIGRFSNELIGEYSFDKNIATKDFNLNVHKNSKGVVPDKITLYGNKRYIYETIIKSNLSAKADKKNPFIQIDMLDTIPTRAQNYLKELIKQYTNLSISREVEDLNISLQDVNKQIADIEQKVKQSQNQMQKFKEKQKIVAPEAQIGALIKEKTQASIELMKNRYQLNLIKNILSQVKKGKNLTSIAPSLMEFGDKVTIKLIGKLQELELQKTTLKQQFTSEYPALKAIKKQIADLKSAILANLQNIYNTMQSRNKELKKVIAKYAKEIESVPNLETKMTNITRTYKFNEKLYAYLLQKKASTQLSIAQTKSKFRVIEPIYTDYKPAKPKRKLIVIVAAITGLILAIFLAFFREFLKGDQEEQNAQEVIADTVIDKKAKDEKKD